MKATLKKLAGKDNKKRAEMPNLNSGAANQASLAPARVPTCTAASDGDVKAPNETFTEHTSRLSSSDSCGSSSRRSSSNSSSSNSEFSSIDPSSCVSKLPQAVRHRAKRPDSPRVLAPSCSSSSSSSGSSGNKASGGGGSYGRDTSCSVPESEAFWSELPSMNPLINPNRLKSLRLCSRDVAGDSQNDRHKYSQNQDAATQQSLQTLTSSFFKNPNNNQCSLGSAPDSSASSASAVAAAAVAAVGDATTRRSADKSTGLTAPSCCGRSELRMANSAQCSRRAVYQYSFRVPDTRANMRAFTDPNDRRVEAIARACDCEIIVDPEPARAAASIRLRRVTIRAPDPHSLEKCCSMFDEKFPHFFVSGGLGPGGQCVSKVFDDGGERYISLSNDECS